MKLLTADDARWLHKDNVARRIIEDFNAAVTRAVADGKTQILFSEISNYPEFQEIVSNGREKGAFILPSENGYHPTLLSNTIKEIIHNNGYGLERYPSDKSLPFKDVIIHWRK